MGSVICFFISIQKPLLTSFRHIRCDTQKFILPTYLMWHLKIFTSPTKHPLILAPVPRKLKTEVCGWAASRRFTRGESKQLERARVRGSSAEIQRLVAAWAVHARGETVAARTMLVWLVRHGSSSWRGSGEDGLHDGLRQQEDFLEQWAHLVEGFEEQQHGKIS